MADVIRITKTERFYIREKEIILYRVLMDTFCIGKKVYDLAGNAFQIAAFETYKPDAKETSIMLKRINGSKEVVGNILLKERNAISFLFCSHPLYEKRVDEDFEQEYQEAAKEHACALFSYEDLETGKLSLRGKISGLTVYRGWMMRPEMYERFYALLKERGIVLINTPEEYSRYHLLPNWYEDFKNETAESVWTSDASLESVLSVSKDLKGPYIIKDYVKSRKHEWYDACFIRDISDKERLLKTAGNFIQRQGEDLVGGVVLRKFEPLKQTGYHPKSGMPLSEEYRVFIYAGKIMVIDAYWNKDSGSALSEKEYHWVESVAARVKSNFVTVDLARKENGNLMIMEFGDGQVSGLQQLNPTEFYSFFNK